MPLFLPLLLCALLAACATDPGSEDLEVEDLPILSNDELTFDHHEVIPDDLEVIHRGPTAALDPIRRACLYEGKDGTGRSSCWYAPATLGACRRIDEIWTGADHCAAAGCLRNNTASSYFLNPAGDQVQIYVYTATRQTGSRFTASDFRLRVGNLSAPLADDVSSALVCHWDGLSD